jgi:hypothetical protein
MEEEIWKIYDKETVDIKMDTEDFRMCLTVKH